ncbi:MAG: hypothetical protein RLY87_1363 [Chloroflexota bacterium]
MVHTTRGYVLARCIVRIDAEEKTRAPLTYKVGGARRTEDGYLCKQRDCVGNARKAFVAT